MPEIYRIKNESFKLPDLMKWFLIYLNVTVLLFFFGPIHYNPRNPGIVVFYLILYHVCLWSGYRYANVRCNFSRESFVRSEDIEIKELKIIKRLIVFGIFVTVMLILRISDTFNPNEIINKVIQGFINPAKRYGEQIEISSSGNLAKGNLFSFLITLGLPFCIVAMVLSVYYFTHLSVGYKLLTICLFALRIASDLISGTNEGIFDVAIYIGVALFLKHQNANLYRKTEHRKKRGNIIMIIAIVLLVYGALSFFTKNIIGRTKGNLAFSTLGENYYDPDRHILKYIPKEILVTFAYLSLLFR